MKTKEKSINQNGCSVCVTGEENYTTFRPSHRPNKLYYQYDYRHTNGELFSTVASTLEECRKKRDKWLQEKHHRMSTIFQCYKQEYVKGVKSGKWEKTLPIIEFGDNATSSMLIDGSGYYIDDPDNDLLYFVDMKQLSETNKF